MLKSTAAVRSENTKTRRAETQTTFFPDLIDFFDHD